MLQRFLRNKRLLLGIPLTDGFFEDFDKVEGHDATKFYNTQGAENTTGWQRLRNLFKKQEDDPIHPAVITVFQNSMAAITLGGIYGALTSSRYTFINFIEKNEATQFRNHLEAKRQLSDAMFKSYIRGFVKWGSKVGVFVTAFTTTQLLLSVYQNKYAFWHYSAGGATAGAIYKFQLGPKGMFAGAVFGGLFGTIYGGLKVLLLILSNQTEEDLVNHRNSLKLWKDELNLKADKEYYNKIEEEELKQAMLNTKNT